MEFEKAEENFFGTTTQSDSEDPTEGQASAVLENLESLPAIKEVSDVGDLPQASNEEAITDVDKEEVEVAWEKADEPKEAQIGEANQVDSQNDNILAESLDRAVGKEMVSDDRALDDAMLRQDGVRVVSPPSRGRGRGVPRGMW
ncbi:hypothetical protein F8388_019458 [Cannabis sativa]|uniref:Uncharacterized protein n=1 Tax=Cannabis sativa TaxID=3483 RepID=A0A7J6HJL1_CANSA|nr:hypothetical protein F8388_019458 [Cannabis sativa]KAF4394868.1 hypothetical protein G4B88_002745 [Cannabis sativa]